MSARTSKSGRPALSTVGTLAGRAAELREVFDRERAALITTGVDEQVESLLAIRVARDGYAIRVNEISGLILRKEIVPVPSPDPALLGLVGVRGTLVPAYSLAIVLGYGSANAEARWLALCGRSDCQAWAFDEFEGYMRIPQSQVHPADRDAARTYVTHTARARKVVRAVVNIPLLRKAIQERCYGSAAKER